MDEQQYDLPFFPLWIDDFDSDTKGLYDNEVGAYLRVLMYQWKNGGAFELKRAKRIIDDSENVWPVLAGFFVEKDGLFYNNRLEEERQKIIKKKIAGSKGGSTTSSRRSSKPSSKSSSTDPSTEGTNPEPITHNLKEQNSELKNNTTPSSKPLSVMSLFFDYNLSFPSMTIPRLLEDVYKHFGEKALRHMLNQLSEVKDLKKRSNPNYVKAMIRNAPLQGIKEGINDEQGQTVKEWTKEEALKYCDRNGARMDQSFKRRENNEGEPDRFEDGTVKFILVTPQEMVSTFAGGANA